MEDISINHIFIIVGIAAIVLELLLGVATGFDLFVLGLIGIVSGGIGIITGSSQYSFIAIGMLSLLYVLAGRQLVKQKLTVSTQTTGTNELIGKKGIVVKKITPQKQGQVKVQGEIWRAESDSAIDEGGSIIVHSVSGVTLRVANV